MGTLAVRLSQVLVTGLVGMLVVVGLAACGGGAITTPTATTAQPTNTPTPSFDAAAYFKGKTVHVIVPLSAGGGTDLIARAVAAQWSKFIPGNPSVVVENKTPNVAGLNYAWESKPDGFTVVTDSASNWYGQQFQQGAKYSAKGWRILGAVSKSEFAMLVRQDVPYQTLADAEHGTYPIKHALAAIDPGQVSGRDVSLMWLADQLDLPLQVYGITNYNSTSVALVAFERGDVNMLNRGGGAGWGGIPELRPGWEKNGFIRQFVSITAPSIKPGPSAEGGPWTAKNVVDYLNADQKKTWLGLLSYPSFDKPFMLPPKTPDNITKALQDSFWETMQDPTAAAAIRKALGSITFDPTQGAADEQETLQNIDNYTSTYPKIATQQQLQAWINKYGK